MASESDARNVLFISHNAADQPYARALEAFIKTLVDGLASIEVCYSTSSQTGPEGGEAWRSWIYDCVVRARTTLIVVTPHALGKPWLVWEAGAVKGASLARQPGPGSEARKGRARVGQAPQGLIVSLAFGLSNAECPDPLRGEQIVQGTDLQRLKELFPNILAAHGLSGPALMTAGARMEKALESFRDAVQAAMRRTPSLINEANVQDWLTRLDEMARAHRLSELAGFERWMMLDFGHEGSADAAAPAAPIDLRLHRRLGELYLGERLYADAVRQLRLAWRAAPRNIFVVRPLAEASMKQLLSLAADDQTEQRRHEVLLLLDAIKELDPTAFKASPDAAALLAKYYRRVLQEPARALVVYQEALAHNPDSYYLADLAAQTALELRQMDQAREHFQQALAITMRLVDNSLWSYATAATACVGLQILPQARENLEKLMLHIKPTETQADSIRRGIREVGERVGVASSALEQLLGVLSTTVPRD